MNALDTALSLAEMVVLLAALWMCVCVPVYVAGAVFVYRRRVRVRAFLTRLYEFAREIEGRRV